MSNTLYVSPHGNDAWNGYLSEIHPTGKDGPLATLDEARRRARYLREQNLACGEVVVKVLPGHYPQARPISIEAQDSHLRFERHGEGAVTIDGSTRITQWEDSTVNGHKCWVANIAPTLAGMDMPPRSLFVNGERCPRSRYPAEGWLYMEDVPDTPEDFELFHGASRFIAAEGDFNKDWTNPQNIEVVVNHLWLEERMPVESYDAQTRLLTSTHRSIFCIKNQSWMGEKPCARYFLENVFEALSEPGQWYVDATQEKLYYLPKKGQTKENTQVNLPTVMQLVRLHGTEEDAVENVHFRGIDFTHTDWQPSQGWGYWWDPQTPPSLWDKRDTFKPFDEYNLYKIPTRKGQPVAATPQSGAESPGVISYEAARNCSLKDCRFEHLGFYAVDIRCASKHLSVRDCHFEDIGFGGVKIDGDSLQGKPSRRTSNILVADNRIHYCGRICSSAVGVIAMHASRVNIEHNEISHQFYTGISVGWTWGYEQSVCQENIVAYNHVHHIGMGKLSDMGGIYMLGLQPGTIIKGNHVHDIEGSHYGGWGIYLDEGSAFMEVCENIVHHTNSQCFYEHWGRCNTLRDNVFALSSNGASVFFCHEERQGYLAYPPQRATMQRNILLSDGQPLFADPMTYLQAGILDSDLNLFYDYAAAENPVVWDLCPWDGVEGETKALSLEELRTHGNERHSIVADPLFKDAKGGDFNLRSDSPAHELGIRVLDTKLCGPRPQDAREPVAKMSFRASTEMKFAD